MRQETLKIYKINELSEEAKQKAVEEYRENNTEIFWQEEIFKSLEGLFNACNGVKMTDYSLGEYHSRLTVSFSNDEAENLTGKRAYAWLENNLFSDLRYKAGINHIKERVWMSEHVKSLNHPQGVFINHIGTLKECPFTGYCADEDYIDALKDGIKSGMTLKEAFESLADEYQKIINGEIEGQNEEGYILDHMSANEYEFLEDGTRY